MGTTEGILIFLAITVLVILIFALFLIRFPRKIMQSRKITSTMLLVSAAVLVISGLVIVLSVEHSKRIASTAKAKQSANSKPKPADNTPIVNYQIMYIDKNRVPAYVQVYSQAHTDAELIKLNDELLPKYKSLNTSVLIAYFDDSKVAVSYFQRKDPPTKEDARHYVAAMLQINNVDKKYKVASNLTRLSGGVKILKSY